MSTPTPAEVYGPRTPVHTRADSRVFDRTMTATHTERRRGDLRDAAIDTAEQLVRELTRLRPRDETDIDLRVESYRRAAARLDDALDALDAALADPACPPIPVPSARDL